MIMYKIIRVKLDVLFIEKDKKKRTNRNIMDIEKLNKDISLQIENSKIPTKGSWSEDYREGLENKDIDALEILLKKIKKDCKIHQIFSISVSSLLTICSLLAYFSPLDFVDMNKIGVLIFIDFSYIVYTFRLLKLKMNLEHDIFLLRILEEIEE